MKIERMMETETAYIQIGDRIHVGNYTATCQEITPTAEPERKKGNEKCSNKLPCGWCSLFDTPCFGRGGEQDE